jgi:integrase
VGGAPVRVAPGVYKQDGTLYAGYREPGGGRWRFAKLEATTIPPAKKEREGILVSLREGRRAPRSAVTVQVLCDEWLATRKGRVAPRSFEYDEGMVGRITRVLGELRVQDVTVRDVRRLLREYAALAERTRYGVLATLQAVMKMGVDEGLIVRDPSAALQRHERPTQKPGRKGRRLSPEQLAHTIEIAERRTPGYAPLIVLLAYSGMRIREALGLRWEDIDLDTATIRVRSQLTKDCLSRVPVKTEAGARDLPVLPALRRWLIEHQLASPWTRPGDPVFAAPNGKPKQYRNVRRALKTISAELGVEVVSHDFRRSLASYLIIAARADEGAVTGVLGHTNIATTRRLYAADWREAEERNEIVLRQLADAGIGQ